MAKGKRHATSLGALDVLTAVWYLLSSMAHWHGGLPWLAAEQLADPEVSRANPILAAYVEWCKTDGRFAAGSCAQWLHRRSLAAVE